MRAEAELLAEDADAFDPGMENRTPEGRRTNVLFEIVTAAAAALRLRRPTPTLRRPFRLVALLDSQSRDGPADHQLLDLLGAFEDVVGLIWTYPLVAAVAIYAI